MTGKQRRQFIKGGIGALFTLSFLPGSLRQAMAGRKTSLPGDEFLWLEEREDCAALAWVKQQNQRTLARFAESEEFRRTEKQILDSFNNQEQIPWISMEGQYGYNFWQDEDHPRGLLRRTTLPEYRKAAPRWETVLDIDALGKAEGKSWVYNGFQSLKTGDPHALIMLSPDGGDAVEIREFNLDTKAFIKEGFYLPSAKSDVSWIDKDTLYVATDFGAGTLTRSGYPRIVKRWRRGTPLSAAETVFEAQPNDISAFAGHDDTKGFERDYVGRVLDGIRQEIFLLTKQGKKIKIDIPADANFSTFREWMLIELKSDWMVKPHRYPSGALLATHFDDFLAGKRDLQVLFTPDQRTALCGYSFTRDHLILSTMKDVVNRLEVLTPQENTWQRRPFGNAPALSTLSAGGIDEETNDYFLTVEGFLQPPSLYMGNLDNDNAPELLKQEPPRFDASRYQVSQYFAESKDGTRVPYFQVALKNIELNGKNPTSLNGYGGFEVSLFPGYLGVEGSIWLEKGGVYVVANIRGGGEYGPAWHQAALRQNRHRAYEDFAAVAEDLIKRKITSPPWLCASGGSNGGLLVGNMLTLYPQLFGCIVCDVPLLDMARYTELSAGASWMAEYGDPSKPKEWEYIKTFSPYHNLNAQQPYPAVLFNTATSDDRVHPAHARKMAARMQKMGYQQAFFFENTEGGHSAAADGQQVAFLGALTAEFIRKHLPASADKENNIS
ncbi:prolyl oligopeptidase family serine peptidase [Pantoea sp.]|uniref:prolyl oligopeptidase family serine peptidase n=1 Tax=Pantoea sp. TaxID=69393 RepID=UPI00289950D9|nr:prolyl oligopeptidase family serine peptidase [Pantoea sp.]